ncbi:unnamed protein product [Amaranthus hypochondriacus]
MDYAKNRGLKGFVAEFGDKIWTEVLKRSLFYQAYALLYEKMKMSEAFDKMYRLGIKKHQKTKENKELFIIS